MAAKTILIWSQKQRILQSEQKKGKGGDCYILQPAEKISLRDTVLYSRKNMKRNCLVHHRYILRTHFSIAESWNGSAVSRTDRKVRDAVTLQLSAEAFLWHVDTLFSCHHGNTIEDNTVRSIAITQVSDWYWSAMNTRRIISRSSFCSCSRGWRCPVGLPVWLQRQMEHHKSFKTLLYKPEAARRGVGTNSAAVY